MWEWSRLRSWCNILKHEDWTPTPSTISFAAVRRLAYEAADAGLPSPELAAGLPRLQSKTK